MKRDSVLFKTLRKLSRFFYSVARAIWREMGVCNHCGADCGFRSTVSRHGFNCQECHDRLTRWC